MYDQYKFKSDLAGGFFNGAIFSLCWGFVNGSYYGYKPLMATNEYLKNIRKYMGRSLFYLTPIFIVARITNNYFKDSGYGNLYSSCMTFLVCFGFLTLFHKKINL